jgi:hypothetical protein
MKQLTRLTESDLHNIIKESVKNILEDKDYVKYPKYKSPYDDKKEGNGVTKPLKDNVSLYDVRGRISNILQAINNNRTTDAKEQLLRLYKLVDAMINQGY